MVFEGLINDGYVHGRWWFIPAGSSLMGLHDMAKTFTQQFNQHNWVPARENSQKQDRGSLRDQPVIM